MKLFFISLQTDSERCLRGRKEQFAKLSYWQRYRGFESLSLRLARSSVKNTIGV